ncbi:hypothetical protein AAV99_02765 [Aurantiacibacter marinus]|uniref:Uncharacterized protein n=1 Tax=Aurantiacibacter marinus TaxID=874156 RepID=A0A0H0XPI7_9SPHN|nr:hypothetical protein AAV99_02765 [Aurantiacibacter marinus]
MKRVARSLSCEGQTIFLGRINAMTLFLALAGTSGLQRRSDCRICLRAMHIAHARSACRYVHGGNRAQFVPPVASRVEST